MSVFWLGAALLAWLAPAEGKVTVHLVPHTHDDVGWLKTVDQYYAGLNKTIQRAYAKTILDTVIQSLMANPERKFTYVEQAFFYRWWMQQSDDMRKTVVGLVQRGQLSFTNGGWCMHDEAVPFYLDMIDQTTLGHRFLNETFGFAPKTGWQLDPFGHSSTQAALLSAEVGIVGLFFGRIDYQDLDLRVRNKAAEFVWRASPSLGDGAEVFSGLTGSYHGNYGPPDGLNWDSAWGEDDTIQDDKRLDDYNVPARVQDFVNAAMVQANQTRGDQVMFTMGADFNYENAQEYFSNMDMIIKYVNEDGRVAALYSTPEQYLEAKAKEASTIAWPLKTDDFFPYADGPHMFWTGYFTSRPALKRYVRESSAYFQVMKQLRVFGLGRDAVALYGPSMKKLSDAMGVAQHHDAVSGTAKQHVTFDYAARLAAGRSDALPVGAKALAKLLGVDESEAAAITVCDLRNVSVCAATQPGYATVVLWNGLAQDRTEVVELPIDGAGASVQTLDGKQVPVQIVPSLPSVTNYGQPAGGGKNTALFAADVPAMGFKAFRLAPATAESQPAPVSVSRAGPAALENEFLKIDFGATGELERITDKATGTSVQAKQSWLYYTPSHGDVDNNSQASGAYIFRPFPNGTAPVFDGPPTFSLVQGNVADEVQQTFGSWVSQRIRLAKGARHVEITYTMGPVPIDFNGKEVVGRITTDIQNSGTCYTDSNGREMLERKRDFRPTWSLNQTEPVAGNYFPVTTAMFIKDDAKQLTVLTDATQAGTGCVTDGVLELMVHRRILYDDARGVTEPLNETESVTPYWGIKKEDMGQHFGRGLVIRGRHLLTLSTPAKAAEAWRPLADSLYLPLQPFFADAGMKPTRDSATALQQPLPPNVQLVSLEQWDEDRVLVRLAHQFGIGEDAALSQPATVDLGTLFAGRSVAAVDERGLAVSITREEVLRRRIPWRVEGEGSPTNSAEAALSATSDGGFAVTLGPLQIRTFLVTFGASVPEGKDAVPQVDEDVVIV